MTSSNRYRVKAAEFAAMSKAETSPNLQLQYAQMAAAYLRLAQLADRNAMNDVVYETAHHNSPRA